jgi:hypothetical protein
LVVSVWKYAALPIAAGAPKAPMASRNTNTDEDTIAGRTRGREMPNEPRQELAPAICAASS